MGGIEKLPEIQKQETRPEDEEEDLPIITEEDFESVEEIFYESEDRELKFGARKSRDVQKSNKGYKMRRGFTQIPHEWLEKLANKELGLTADELRVMLLIFRESYGRNGRKPLSKRWQTIKREQFTLVTGIPDRSIRRIIDKLERDELIEVMRTAHCKGKNWRFKPNEELIGPKNDDSF